MEKFNIAAEILDRARSRGNHLAFTGRDGEVTYAELADRVSRQAEWLRSFPEFSRANSPRMGVSFPEGVGHVVGMLGVMLGGGCAVPVPREFSTRERMELETLTALHGLLHGASEAHPEVEWKEGVAPAFPVDEFHALNPAMVRFSSGTTGRTKGVVLSHGTIRDRVESANRRLRITAHDYVLWTLPMAHHFAVSILLYLYEGATVLLPGGNLAEDLLLAANERGATIFYGSPFQAQLLSAESSGKKWNTLRSAVSTTAPLSGVVAEKFQQRFGVPLVQAFGIIEAGLPLIARASHDPGSVGREDDFEVIIEGPSGELCLRGPGMFDAYLSPWITRSEAMNDGWFRTGDLAERAADGSIKIVGRSKSVINVGGSKCFPEEVETVLIQHPEVVGVRVFGDSHPTWGMIPVAEILPRDSMCPPSAAELVVFARERLAAYKVPARFKVVDSLPITGSGKIIRA
jgi:acyl-CoA synthetase (AMP-forming)/AMP-acid ligase II